MSKEQQIDIVSKDEIYVLLAIALGLGIVSAILVVTGMLPLKAAIGLSGLAFMGIYFFHIHWRYGPLKEAIGSIANENFETAITIIDKYLASGFNRKGRPRMLANVLKASCLFYLEKLDEAIELSHSIIKNTDCEQIRFFAQNNLVSCYVCQKKPIRANSERAKILTMAVSEIEKRQALINIGLCYMNVEFFREAIETWDEAMQLEPDNEQKAYITGFQSACLNRIRDYDKALEKIAVMKELKPRASLTKAIMLDNEAFALANKREKLDEALAMCKEAFSLNIMAAEPHLHMTLGEVHYARGEFDDALEELNCAIEKMSERDKTSHQKAYLTLGKIHQARGNDKEAQAALNRSISIDPTKTLAGHAQQILRDPATYNTAVSKPGQALKMPEDN